MQQISTFLINSTRELRDAALDWNDLWKRSSAESPVFQAELVAHCVEEFHQGSQFKAIVVVDGGIWRAALPLVIDRDMAGQSTGRLFARHLVVDGLMQDPYGERRTALEALVRELRRCRLARVWIENVPLSASHWQEFGNVIEENGVAATVKTGYVAGKITIDQPWESFEKHLPRDRRAELRRTTRRLKELGKVTFRFVENFSAASAAEEVARGFALEDTGWKGERGSSVRKRGMLPFFMEQATFLAKCGQLRLAFLELDERPIAFGYMPCAKGICSLVKYAYDSQFAKVGPGQLLLLEMLQHMFASPQAYKCLDLPGMLTASLADWANAEYQVGQYGLGFGVMGKTAVFLHRHVWPHLKQSMRS
jgi:CelD/BcsL family acetyltransferase involved in cellulose biosynthesis